MSPHPRTIDLGFIVEPDPMPSILVEIGALIGTCGALAVVLCLIWIGCLARTPDPFVGVPSVAFRPITVAGR